MDATVAFEAGLSREERRRVGIFNTPFDVALSACRGLLDRPGVVLDPSCGTGTFLLAAREVLGPGARLIGVDVDPEAIAIARERVPDAELHVGDGLAWSTPVDFVVGNPPYVDGRLQARFLELACRLSDAVAMVVPTSLLATNEGRAFRSSGLGVAAMTPLGRVFDADVDTCVLVLRRGAPVPDGPTWSGLLVPGDVPDVSLCGPTLGESCDVVAGFRQHYYGLRGCVADGGDGLRLVTSGSIDVGARNDRPVRFDGVRYVDPRVRVDGISDDAVRDWYAALLRPKVVVATQTRVIEAAADVDGSIVPSVPVISVLPRDAARIWDVLAVLLAPPVTAWCVRRWSGTALSATALKLGAPNIREIPVPARDWSAAAALVRAGDVDGAARAMCEAYGVGEEVFEWWLHRRGPQR